MATVKMHDFVEIDYIGRVIEDNSVFDTTEEKVAKENNSYNENSDYGPVVLCVGENHLPKALEDQLVGKETEKSYRIEISHEDAFGKKNAKLIQMIPLNKFRQQKISPFPGLQLNIDGMFGVVRTVSSGRCLVDFNHPLAGKDISYEVKVKRIVENDNEKLKSLLKNLLRIKDAEIEVKDGAASIILKHELPKEVQQEFQKAAERVITSIKKFDFSTAKTVGK